MSDDVPFTVSISYRREADSTFIKVLIQAIEDLKAQGTHLSWEVVYDENAQVAGDSISAFTKNLPQANRIILLLSPAYFESKHCLSELLEAHKQRSADLTPVIVNVEQTPLLSRADMLAESRGHLPAGYDVNELETALFWILGLYDEDKENYDALFHQYDSQNPIICGEKVLRELETECTPKYPYYSVEKREQAISKKVATLLSKQAMGSYRALLLVTFGFQPSTQDSGDIHNDIQLLASRLSKPCNMEQLIHKLDKIGEAVVEFEFSQHSAAHEVAQYIKDLTGWVLITAANEQAFYRLSHALNRNNHPIMQNIKEGTFLSYQLLIAAMKLAPAVYKSSEHRFKGKGEINLSKTESGLTSTAVVHRLETELEWSNLFDHIYRDVPSSKPGDDREIILGNLKKLFSNNPDYYVRLSDDTPLPVRKSLTDAFKGLPMVVANSLGKTEVEFYTDAKKEQLGALVECMGKIYKNLPNESFRY